MKETGDIKLWFKEDSDHTEARATLIIHGAAFTGAGRARRNPTDTDMPMVGEELAAARALSDLAHRLLGAAAATIRDKEGAPVYLRG